MAKKSAISNPSELALRIETSLKKDASGGNMIEGAYTTPRGYLAAMNAAGANVQGVSALPAYLQTLIETEMPTVGVTMSRVAYKRAADCAETYEVDVQKGYTRIAIGKEKAWVDPNTGNMILAENCTNSPLSPTTLEKVNKLAASTPNLATLLGDCEEGSHQTLILHVWDHDSLSSSLKSKYVDLAEDERDFQGPSVSRNMGAELRKAGKLDEIKHISKPFDIRVSLIKEGQGAKMVEENIETIAVMAGAWAKKFPVLRTKEWSLRIIPSPAQSAGVEVTAPLVSPKTGFPEIRFHPNEWKDFCRVHVHMIAQQ